MKRNEFLISCAGIPLLLSGMHRSGKYYAENTNTFQDREGFKVSAGEGRTHGHIQLQGVNKNKMDMKVSGQDSLGGMSIFEQISLTPGHGTPYHVHFLQDEVFHVIDGAYAFLVGGNRYDLVTGDSIFLPMKVPHAWTQVSKKGKMIVIFQPAGKMEEFFLTMAGMNYEPSKEEIAAIFKDHEMEVVGPPLQI